MPTHTRLVEVTLPEAEVLADLYGIAFDLETVEELCAKVVETAKLKPRDWLVEEALVASAIIKYGRCFTDGVRMRLGTDDLVELESDAVSEHEYFMELRHKFVAHSVNAFEETYVSAAARERDGERLPVVSINPGQHRIVLSAGMGEAIGKLASKVKALVKLKVEFEEEKLLAHIQSLPLDVVHSGDLHSSRPSIDVRKPRKRSNNAFKRRRAKMHAP